MKVGSKVLGLAVGQKSVLIAEVLQKGDRHVVSHVAEFPFPDDLPLSQPEKLGEALAQFLKKNRFTAKEAVIGLPAKRLITRRKEIPAATPAVAASTLRLQAEGEFSSELDNLIMDFAGTPSASEATTVLLVATNKVVVDECAIMARSAGLRVHGVTSSTAALGRTTSRLPGGDGYVVSVSQNGAELVVQHGRDPAHMRHLAVAGGAEALAGEIRRTLASIPKNGTPATLALWEEGGESARNILEQRLSMPVNVPELRKLVVTDSAEAARYIPAIAVALTAMESTGLPVDFLNSRLAPPKEPVISRTKLIAICAIVLVVLLAMLAYIDLDAKQTELNRINKRVNDPDTTKVITRAEADIKRLDTASRAIKQNAQYIEVLKDLAALLDNRDFGPETLWFTSISNSRDVYTWQVEGKSSDDRKPRALRDLMSNEKNRKLFENVSVEVATRATDGGFSFTLDFTRPRPASAVQPARGTRGRGQ